MDTFVCLLLLFISSVSVEPAGGFAADDAEVPAIAPAVPNGSAATTNAWSAGRPNQTPAITPAPATSSFDDQPAMNGGGSSGGNVAWDQPVVSEWEPVASKASTASSSKTVAPIAVSATAKKPVTAGAPAPAPAPTTSGPGTWAALLKRKPAPPPAPPAPPKPEPKAEPVQPAAPATTPVTTTSASSTSSNDRVGPPDGVIISQEDALSSLKMSGDDNVLSSGDKAVGPAKGTPGRGGAAATARRPTAKARGGATTAASGPEGEGERTETTTEAVDATADSLSRVKLGQWDSLGAGNEGGNILFGAFGVEEPSANKTATGAPALWAGAATAQATKPSTSPTVPKPNTVSTRV